MSTPIKKRAIPVPRQPENRETIDALRVAVDELSGTVGDPGQRCIRLCELIDAGIVQLTPEGRIMKPA